MCLLLVFVEVSRDNQRFFFASNREREPDEILQNQSSPRGSDRPSIVRCRVVLIGSDGHSLLLTYIRKELWLVPHTLLGHFIVTNLHSENLHDSNSVYLRKRSRHKNEELSMALMCVTYWGGTVGSKVSMSGKTGGSSLNIGKLRTSLKESNSIKITFKFIFLLCLLYYCHMAEYNIIHLGQGGHDKNITQWKAIIRKWIDQSTPIDVS